MCFSDQKIDNIARLARLKLSENDKIKLSKDLNAIMDWINILKQVDVTNVEPLLNVSESNCPMRDDVVFMENNRTDVLINTPSPDQNDVEKREFFTVPKVIE